MVYKKNQEFMRKVDLFSKPVSLTLNQSKKIKTPFGGFLSLLVFGIILLGIVDQVLVILKAAFTNNATTYSFASSGTATYSISTD